jgi:glycosyltransferase involved in cell wall biosynthesis
MITHAVRDELANRWSSLGLRTKRVHLEMGPVLVNRTAVYQMCRSASGELAARGFRVNCSALLARLGPDAEPSGPRERDLFERSRRWLSDAVGNPAYFLKQTRHLKGLWARLRHARGTSLFFDPFYTLFFGGLSRGVVLVYDTTCVTDPDWHPPGVGSLYEAALARLARSRFHFVAASRNTADQLRVNWGVAPSRITVQHLGLFPPAPPDLDAGKYPSAPYLLFVGSLENRKNLLGLIRAYRTSGLFLQHGIRLRLIGLKNEDNHPISVEARATPGVDVGGFASAGEITASYQGCLAFVYPSLCEGFGLPLLEAMHHGCLCLSTICGASPEVSSDAALYVNPYDSDDVSRGLRRLIELPETERRALQSRARQRAATFTWSRFYDGLAGVLRHHGSGARTGSSAAKAPQRCILTTDH